MKLFSNNNKTIFFSFFILFLIMGLSFSRNKIYDSCWDVYGVERKDGEVSCLSFVEIKLFFMPIFDKSYKVKTTPIEEGADSGMFGHEFAFNYPMINEFGFPFTWIASGPCGPLGVATCWHSLNILFLFFDIIIYFLLARLIVLILKK